MNYNIYRLHSRYRQSKTRCYRSSLSSWMEQLYGCFEEIDNSLLFGKGFGWTGYYTTLHGDHPIILSFERPNLYHTLQ